jgi:hypothetical protein
MIPKTIPWDLIRQLNFRDALFIIRRKVRLAADRKRFSTRPSNPAPEEIAPLLGPDFPGINLHPDEFFNKLCENWFNSTPECNPARQFQGNISLLSNERKDSILDRADRILEGRYPLMGNQTVRIETPVDWHKCPVSGKRWPETGFPEVDLSGRWADPPVDVKFIWELNRHKHLYPLGQAFLISGDEKYAKAIEATLLGWIEQNPPGWGVNWAGPLELGIRSMAWSWAVDCLEEFSSLKGGTLAKILLSIDRQIGFMEHYLEDYLVRNTHLVGEAAALAWVGLSCPGLMAAESWVEKGKQLLEQQMHRQVLPTGQHYERSSYYHNYMIDFCAGVFILGSNTGHSYPEQWRHQLEKMYAWLARFAPPGPRLPDCKDADGGQVFGWTEEALLGWKSRLAWGGVLFDNEEWIALSQGDETFLPYFFTPMEIENFRKQKKNTPPDGLQSDEERTVIRASVDSHPVYLLFDHSALGVGRCGHGHADLLQVLLQVGEQPVLIDPGTYTYNASAQWRNAFRTTAAHNTVAMDGHSQVEPGGPFDWKGNVKASSAIPLYHQGYGILSAGHDAFRQLGPEVHHERSLFLIQNVPESWIIFCVDQLKCREKRQAELFWHFHPGVAQWDEEEKVVHLELPKGLEGNLVVDSTEKINFDWVEAEQPGREPGWHSPVYGIKQPAPVLVGRTSNQGQGLLITVIHLSGSEQSPLGTLEIKTRQETWRAVYETAAREFVVSSGKLHIENIPLEAEGSRFLVDTSKNSGILRILGSQITKLKWADELYLDSVNGSSGMVEINRKEKSYRWCPSGGDKAEIRTNLDRIEEPFTTAGH